MPELLRYAKHFFKLNFQDRLLLSEAFFLSGIYSLLVKIIPFRHLSRLIGKYRNESPFDSETTQYAILRRISWAIETVSRHTPWKCECLVQAMIVQSMLKKRKIHYTIYLGVLKDNGSLMAHAWTRSGRMYITGYREKKGFVEVARFSNYDGR